MSDFVAGIAILDRTMTPQRLAILCRPAGKHDRVEIIPVYAKGTPKPVTHNGAAWEYEIHGDRLFVTPSVHCRSQRPRPGGDERDPSQWEWQTDFHNAGSWDVQFRDAGPPENDASWPTKHLWRDLREANAS